MPITPGTRLGPYEIASPIGAGGMGEVYRARDRKLDRDVAIKVLPSHLSSDPDALARFEREAKAVAALSHPNILAIHDFGRDEATGVAYAVMELLDGSTLRERLAAGALPPKKVVQIGVEIAQGLAAAHARGVVHRDVKPENIFVTADGRVKILDFGLARAAVRAGAETDSPTELRQTDPGTVLGTAGYMSPEQVRGLPADHRSDVFSLGCVLFELATGQRAFQRGTAAETMTAILREDPPDLELASGSTPAAIEPVIRHCLEKQPDERFQSARDLAFALGALSGATTQSGAVATVGVEPRARRLPVIPIVLAAAVVAAFFAGRALAPSAGIGAGKAPPTFQQLTDDAGVETDPVISPDGTSIAFTRVSPGRSEIFVQRIGGRTAIHIAGEPGRPTGAPAFSPDGGSIAFHQVGGSGGIFITGATGESARRLTDVGFHPAWSPDGQRVLFCTEAIVAPTSRSATSALWVVDAKGGAPRKISDGDVVQPSWSPSGSRIVYWAAETGQRDVYTMPAGGGARTALTSDVALDWSPVWARDGFVYFSSDRGGTTNIWRIAVDESSGTARGVPEPVTAGVTSAEQPSLTSDGSRLVFRSSTMSTNPAAIPFDPATGRAGPMQVLLDRTGNIVPTGISPDGQWLTASTTGDRQEDVVVLRTDGTGLRRLTDDEFRDRAPVWSPDGREIAFYTNRTDSYTIWSVKPDGSGLHALTASPDTGIPRNWTSPTYSPTGDRLAAGHSRLSEAVIIDPRVAWASQSPTTLNLTLPDGSWLLPTGWSRDGRRLSGGIFNAAGGPFGIGVYDIAARAVRKVYDGPVSGWGIPWLEDHRRVLFGAEGAIWLLDVDTGKTQRVADGVPASQGPVLSPDGRTMYIGVRKLQADVWLVELMAKKR